MSLQNIGLDLLTETVISNGDLDMILENGLVELPILSASDGHIELSEDIVSLLTESLTGKQLDAAWRKLMNKAGPKWNSTGWTRKQLTAMGKQQNFLRHQVHLQRMLSGGVNDKGESINSSGRYDFGGLIIADKEAGMRVRGSYEWLEAGQSPNIYQQTIRFANWNHIIRDKSLDWMDKARLLMRDRIKIHCDCPAFRYYYAYAASKKGFGLYPEIRPSNITNPKKKGGICKHLQVALNLLGTNHSHIASQLKSHYSQGKP